MKCDCIWEVSRNWSAPCANFSSIYEFTVAPPNKGHFGAGHAILCREVVHFSEVQMYGNGTLKCPLQRGRPLPGGSFIGGSSVFSYYLVCTDHGNEIMICPSTMGTNRSTIWPIILPAFNSTSCYAPNSVSEDRAIAYKRKDAFRLSFMVLLPVRVRGPHLQWNGYIYSCAVVAFSDILYNIP